MLLLTIWLQGVWLPLHGIPYEETPLWAGIYLASLVAGNIAFGPLSGALSDRYGPRVFAVLGMVVFTSSLGALALSPTTSPRQRSSWRFSSTAWGRASSTPRTRPR
jgi:MFS family permease